MSETSLFGEPAAEHFEDNFHTVVPDPLQSERCAAQLRVLSEPLRLRIIDYLRSGPKSVSEIGESLQTEIVTVSHHLGILKNAGLVERERKGRFMLYKLRDGLIELRNCNAPDYLDLGCCRLELPK